MLPPNINVILLKTRFPENIGMAARACANMGCGELWLAEPRWWDFARALPLATPQGMPLLQNIRIFDSLETAVADRNLVFGTSARKGGWRARAMPPWQAANKIMAAANEGYTVSLLFGPEDSGLANTEISICQEIIHVPTPGNAASLNLAQAVLLVLYECAKNAQDLKKEARIDKRGRNYPTMSELGLLRAELEMALHRLDCCQDSNTGYFFRQWSELLNRVQLRRHEFDALMGFCRQLRHKLKY